MKNYFERVKWILICAMAPILFGLSGCEKFLEAKPDQKLATIETVADMQALLDDFATLNYNDPAMGEACGDNYYLTDAVFNSFSEYDRNLYIWAGAYVFAPQSNAWNNLYKQVNVANTILAAVNDKRATIKDVAGLSHVTAQARFFRGKAFYHGVTTWAMPYDGAVAQSLLGIPLRMSANFNSPSTRSTLAESYAQVLSDLKASIAGLPALAISPTRPSKAAAYGMLCRTYLQLRDYPTARLYADSCLRLQATLLDYNTLTASASFPVPKLNVEIVFEGRVATVAPLVQSRGLIAPDLFALYENNDLRKTVFFRASGSTYLFKGSYEAAATFFNGITTAEMLLSRAECAARAGDLQVALQDLNTLLPKRYRTGTFIPRSGTDAAAVLAMLKLERRKELAFRCMRWLDIRRWNEEGDGLVLQRTVNGKTYTLPVKAKRYALPIPEDVIDLSGMVQNER